VYAGRARVCGPHKMCGAGRVLCGAGLNGAGRPALPPLFLGVGVWNEYGFDFQLKFISLSPKKNCFSF